MADELETKGKKGRAESERAQGEPIPKRQDFASWLEEAFWGPPEDAQFPEKVEVRAVSGRGYERQGARIMQKLFDTTDKSNKPSKAAVVTFSNKILSETQRDCDVQRKRVVYAVNLIHFMRDDQPYERFLLDMKPTGVYRNDGSPRHEDDDEEGMAEKFGVQVLRHQETMVGLLGGGFEGLLDRFDRVLERQEGSIEKRDKTIEDLHTELRKARLDALDIEERRAWMSIKVKGAEKVLDTGLMLLPPLMHRLLGKGAASTGETYETITLKKFFLKKEEGGIVTQEQMNAIFGDYEKEPPHAMKQQGALSYEQGDLIYRVANCQIPGDELNKLMPGGPLAVSEEQVMKLQTECGLGLEQLAPLMLIFEARQKRVADGSGT